MSAQVEDISVFETDLTVAASWLLDEHRLVDRPIAPGSTYLELAVAASELHHGRAIDVVTDVRFVKPLSVSGDESATVQTTVTETAPGTSDFRITSRIGERSWQLHATGRSSTTSAGPRPESVHPSVLAGETRRLAGRELQMSNRSMRFGERWLGSLEWVTAHGGTAVGRFTLAPRYADDIHGFALHPALLDIATGLGRLAAGASEDAEDLFLPVGYDRLARWGPIPASGYSVTTFRRNQSTSRLRTTDVIICDELGEVAVQITGFRAALVSDPVATAESLAGGPALHSLKWESAPGTSRTVSPSPEAIVIVEADTGQAGIAERLVEVAAPRPTSIVRYDRDGRHPIDEESMGSIALTLTEHPEALLVFIPPSEPPLSHAHDVPSSTAVIETLFALVKELASHGAPVQRLRIVSSPVAAVSGREETLNPLGGACFALADVIAHEFPSCDVRSIDVDAWTPLESVIHECDRQDGPVRVALRDGKRLAPYVSPLPDSERERSVLADGFDAALITGGGGGLGLAIAEHLSVTRPGVRLVLVGRRPESALPPASRELIQRARQNGSEVVYVAADIADLEQMRPIVDTMRVHESRWIVIHAAGLAGDGFILRKEIETFRTTISPKIVGATVLDALTASCSPCLMINFGSTVTIFGAAGQSDYSAANGYLDSFAEARSFRGSPTLTIDWTDWKTVGMAHALGVVPDQGFFRSIEVEEALTVFDRILTSETPARVIVGQINPSSRPPDVSRSGRSPVRVDKRLVRTGDNKTWETPSASASASASDLSPQKRFELTGRGDEEYAPLEFTLGSVWANELGLTSIDVNASLFDLGMDSLSGLRLADAVERATGIAASIVDVLQYDSIAELASALELRRTGGS
ncbi:SDR family NAD(P)-dependent oxidoreductase [Microbacterium enclense]|uniref:SDR family NAD(P)-dependent oxidoreductase n=1 Tax=Microbacterium enclense TaxID=993073 RepID=UPI003F7F0333